MYKVKGVASSAIYTGTERPQQTVPVSPVPSLQLTTGTGTRRSDPLLKQVDEQLKKLKKQFDSMKPDSWTHNTSDTSKRSLQNQNPEGKPMTASTIGLTFTPKLSHSFGSPNTKQPSSSTSFGRITSKPKLFKTPTKAVKFDPRKGYRDHEASFELKSMSSQKSLVEDSSSSRIFDGMHFKQLDLEERERSLKERMEEKERELRFKEEEMEARRRRDREARETEEGIRRKELERYAEETEKLAMLGKAYEALSKQNSSLKIEINKLNTQIQTLSTHQQQNQQLQSTLFQSNQKIAQLQHLNKQFIEQIEKLKANLTELEQSSNQQIFQDNSQTAFNLAMRTTHQQISRLKQRLLDKDSQSNHVRDLNKQLRSQLDCLRSQLEITRLKHLSEVKNLQTEKDIQLQNLKNEKSTLEKLVTVLDEKFKFLLKEERKKDEFMVGYFRGKVKEEGQKQLIARFFKQFEQVPKVTFSELVRREQQVQEGLRAEVARLEREIQVREKLYLEREIGRGRY